MRKNTHSKKEKRVASMRRSKGYKNVDESTGPLTFVQTLTSGVTGTASASFDMMKDLVFRANEWTAEHGAEVGTFLTTGTVGVVAAGTPIGLFANIVALSTLSHTTIDLFDQNVPKIDIVGVYNHLFGGGQKGGEEKSESEQAPTVTVGNGVSNATSSASSSGYGDWTLLPGTCDAFIPPAGGGNSTACEAPAQSPSSWTLSYAGHSVCIPAHNSTSTSRLSSLETKFVDLMSARLDGKEVCRNMPITGYFKRESIKSGDNIKQKMAVEAIEKLEKAWDDRIKDAKQNSTDRLLQDTVVETLDRILIEMMLNDVQLPKERAEAAMNAVRKGVIDRYGTDGSITNFEADVLIPFGRQLNKLVIDLVGLDPEVCIPASVLGPDPEPEKIEIEPEAEATGKQERDYSKPLNYDETSAAQGPFDNPTDPVIITHASSSSSSNSTSSSAPQPPPSLSFDQSGVCLPSASTNSTLPGLCVIPPVTASESSSSSSSYSVDQGGVCPPSANTNSTLPDMCGIPPPFADSSSSSSSSSDPPGPEFEFEFSRPSSPHTSGGNYTDTSEANYAPPQEPSSSYSPGGYDGILNCFGSGGNYTETECPAQDSYAETQLGSGTSPATFNFATTMGSLAVGVALGAPAAFTDYSSVLDVEAMEKDEEEEEKERRVLYANRSFINFISTSYQRLTRRREGCRPAFDPIPPL
jgi:hypothetical protein